MACENSEGVNFDSHKKFKSINMTRLHEETVSWAKTGFVFIFLIFEVRHNCNEAFAPQVVLKSLPLGLYFPEDTFSMI